MVIWELKQVGDLFPFFTKKGDAHRALAAYRRELGSRKEGAGPEEVVVKNRDDLIDLLKRVKQVDEPVEEDEASEFL